MKEVTRDNSGKLQDLVTIYMGIMKVNDHSCHQGSFGAWILIGGKHFGKDRGKSGR